MGVELPSLELEFAKWLETLPWSRLGLPLEKILPMPLSVLCNLYLGDDINADHMLAENFSQNKLTNGVKDQKNMSDSGFGGTSVVDLPNSSIDGKGLNEQFSSLGVSNVAFSRLHPGIKVIFCYMNLAVSTYMLKLLLNHVNYVHRYFKQHTDLYIEMTQDVNLIFLNFRALSQEP